MAELSARGTGNRVCKFNLGTVICESAAPILTDGRDTCGRDTCHQASCTPFGLIFRRCCISPAAGYWESPFDFCRFICRTHKRSTAHENAYIGARHHCFSHLGRPLVSGPLAAEVASRITMVLGAHGQPCDAACASKSMVCSGQDFAHLNSCDRMRENGNCEAGCEAEPAADWHPGYMRTEAPKKSKPGMCIVSQPSGTASGDLRGLLSVNNATAQHSGGGRSMLQAQTGSCSAKAPDTLRLCPCARA